MASATYDFAFKILGGLEPTFGKSLKNAEQKIGFTEQKIKELQNTLNQMESAYKAGALSADSFAKNSASIASKINKETEALEGLVKEQEKYQSLQSGTDNFKGMIAGGVAGLAGSLTIGAVLNELNAYQTAMGQAQAMTGATGAEWQEIQSAIQGSYAAGFGADMNDVATAAGQIQQIIGSMNVDMQEATQHAMLLRDTFGFEVTESARSAKVMMEQFGISEKQAYTLMAQGAQLGADKNGDLLDTLNEYSVQFKQLGFDAESFMNIIVSGAQSGVWSVDKIGDSIKEFGIRVKDGSKTTTEGFQAIGLDADEMAQKFAAGGDSAQKAFLETINALKAMEDPVARNQAGVNLFGTMWEDMGEKAIFAMTDVNNAVNMNGATLEEMTSQKMNNFNTAITKLGRSLEMYIVAPLAEYVTPAIMEFADILGTIDPSLLIAGIAGLGAAIAAFQIGSFIASFGSLIGVVTGAGAAIAAISWPIVSAAVVIGLLVAAGIYLMNNWDEITAMAASLADSVGAAFDNLCSSVVATAYSLVSSVGGAFDSLYSTVIGIINSIVAEGEALWNEFVSFLSHPIDSTINLVKNITTNGDVASNALGGIYPKGAFLTTFAEETPEAAIPLDGGSSRSIGLWQQAGEALGMYPASNFSSAGDSNTTVNATFAPNITIQGNSNGQDVQNAISNEFEKFKAFMKRYQNEQRRVSYA